MAKYSRAPIRIMPLTQPNVEIMTATAMNGTPRRGVACASTAVPTRSSLAWAMPRTSGVAPAGSPVTGRAAR